MRHTKVDKPADQGEVLSYSEPEVYMRRANDVKERVPTRGGLTDDNPEDWRSKACCEKSAESIVVGPVADEGSNLLEFGTKPTKSHGAEKITCLQRIATEWRRYAEGHKDRHKNGQYQTYFRPV